MESKVLSRWCGAEGPCTVLQPSSNHGNEPMARSFCTVARPTASCVSSLGRLVDGLPLVGPCLLALCCVSDDEELCVGML